MEFDEKDLLATPRFRIAQITTTGEDGRQLQREVVRHPGAVTILALVDTNRVCLIRNRRVAVDKTLIELPAGTREPGESPLETAHRELIEETGYQADRLALLTEFYLSPGILDERMYLYLAEDLTDVGPRREAGEEIENLVVEWDAAIRLIEDGEIEDAKTIVGLLFYDRLRDEKLR
jgi:ADP-ribose pyrophosphatase